MINKIRCFLFGHVPGPPPYIEVSDKYHYKTVGCLRCGGVINIQYRRVVINGLKVIEYREL